MQNRRIETLKDDGEREISLVIPNRNNVRYLDACLHSVACQTDKRFVFIVSDNHSTDGSMEIISTYKEYIDKIISPPAPLGYKEHLIWIINQVQTRFVIFLAGDDIAHYELIYSYIKSLKEAGQTSPAFVCSPFYYIDEHSNIYNRLKWPRQFCGARNDMLNIFLKGPICNISSVAWDVNQLKGIHIPEEIGNSIDWYLYIILSSKNNVLLVNKRLLFYRVHRESTGNSNIVAHTDTCRRLFLYLKKNVFGCDAVSLRQINSNINDFDRVIAGGRANSIKQLAKKLVNLFSASVFRLYKHPQLKR